MTSELLGASVAAVTTTFDAGGVAHGLGGRGPGPIVVHPEELTVGPLRVRTTLWQAAIICVGTNGFMLNVGKKPHAQSLANCDGRISTSGAAGAPWPCRGILQKTWFWSPC